MDANSTKLVSKVGFFQKVLGRAVKLSEEDLTSESEKDLVRDAFWSYYLPTHAQKEEIPTEREINKKLLDWVMEGQAWQASKFTTSGKMVVSTKAAELLALQLLNDPEVKKAMEAQTEAEEKELEAQEQEAEAQEQAEQGDSQAAAKAQGKAKQARAEAQASIDKANATLDKRTNSPEGKAIRAAATKEAKKGAEEIAEVMATWGIEDGEGSTLNIEDIKAMQEKLTKGKLASIVEAMGRCQGIALKALQSHSKHETVVTDAGYTRNVMDVFSTQRTYLLNQQVPLILRAKTVGDFVQTGLLGITKSSESKYTGGMVIGIDGSGSMGSSDEVMAKGLMMGIAKAAADTGQEYHAFTFGSANQLTETITNRSNPAQFIPWLEKMFGGGTDFNRALEHAVEILSSMEDPSSHDILMLTDGQADITEETRNLLAEAKQRWGTRMFTILVGRAAYGDITEVSDFVVNINNAGDMERAAQELSDKLQEA